MAAFTIEGLPVVGVSSVDGYFVIGAGIGFTAEGVITLGLNQVISDSLSEVGVASDSFSGQFVFTPSLPESGAAADSMVGSTLTNRAVVETGVASDVVSPTGILVVAVVESGSVVDSIGFDPQYPISESLNGQDIYTGPVQYLVEVLSLLEGADSVTSTQSLFDTLLEAGSLLDAVTRVGILAGVLVESGSLLDLVNEQNSFVNLSELLEFEEVWFSTAQRVVVNGSFTAALYIREFPHK